MKKQIDFRIVSLVFSVLVLCFVIAFYAVGWDEPQQSPPGCTSGQPGCDAPINVSGTSQDKSGALRIGGVFRTDSETVLAVLGGNVGIGTTSPQAKLHIGGIAGTDGIMFPDGTLQTTAGGGAITPGTWCGLKMSVHPVPVFSCDGHNPQVSCPTGYTSVLFASMGALGGDWYTCVKN